MQYPLKVTEIPHKGKEETWIICSAKHLDKLISKAAIEHDCPADSLFEYLNWLEKDLKQLKVEEIGISS